MYWHSGRFVYDDHIIIFVDNADRLARHRRLVTMESVRYYIAVLDDGIDRRDRITIENNLTTLYSIFLEHISKETSSYTENTDPHVVLLGAIPELASKDVKQLSATPTFFAVRVVREVIWRHLSQAIFFIIWSRPRIAWCSDHFWWGLEHFRSGRFKRGGFHNGHGHTDGRQAASPREMCKDAR